MDSFIDDYSLPHFANGDVRAEYDRFQQTEGKLHAVEQQITVLQERIQQMSLHANHTADQVLDAQYYVRNRAIILTTFRAKHCNETSRRLNMKTLLSLGIWK